MNLTVANISSQIGAAQFQAAIAAIGRQVDEDFQPEWGITANLRGVVTSLQNHEAPIQGNHDAIIYLGDSSQDPTTGVSGALGYHSDNYAKIPYGFVYLDICAQYDEVWTTTLSHEVLELLADPTAVMTVTGPAPNGSPGKVYYDLEVCDPTQGDSYTIDGVALSNFVGRSYFGLTGGSGKTNYLGLDLAAFGVRPKGYFQYETGNETLQVQGELVTERQLAAKRLMKNGRRNERRKQRTHKTGVKMMSAQTSQRSLREILATNPDLRRKAYQAATLAAYNVIKDAGFTVTAADIAEARADIAAMTIPANTVLPPSPIQADTAGDVIDGVGTAVGIGIALGF